MVEVVQSSSATASQDDAARQPWHAPAQFLDSLPVALCFCDSDGRLLHSNRRGAELLGREPSVRHAEASLGNVVHALEPAGTAIPFEQSPIAEALRTGTTLRECEAVAERPDGSRVSVLLSIDAVRDADGTILGALVCMQDLTTRKRLEQSVTRRMAEQAALYEFTDRLFRAGSRGEVYDAALDAIIRALGCSRASILLFDQDGHMDFVAWRGLSGDYRRAVAGHSPWRPEDKKAKPVCVPDVTRSNFPAELLEALQQERIGALAFIPLMADGAVIGKFMTYYATPHAFGHEEVDLALTIARQLGFAIARLKADEARAAAERALTTERELLTTIINQAPLLMTLYQPETGIFRLNRQFEELIGWKTDEASAELLMEQTYPDPEYRERVAAFIDACSDGWMDISMRTRTGRTIETSWANFRLSNGIRVGIGIDITDRKRAETQQALLLGEMSHRLRNLFVVASSVVNLSASEAHTPGEMAEAVQDRLGALTRAHDLTRPRRPLAQHDRLEQETTLWALLSAIFAPYAAADAVPRFRARGGDVLIAGDAVTGLALLLHEFTTNAAKHGALSSPTGFVEVDCTVEGAELEFAWRERGGPPVDGPREASGFGAYLIDRVVAGQFGGRMASHWQRDGVEIRLRLPLDRLQPGRVPGGSTA